MMRDCWMLNANYKFKSSGFGNESNDYNTMMQ